LASDEPSLAALYLRNREAMLRAACAILRDQHDAEDAVSAAVVKVAARIADGYPIDDVGAYLIQSARNAALDELRASSRRRGNRCLPPLAAAPPGDIVDASPDVADQVIERQRSTELRAEVQRTVGSLPEREASMLAMLLAGHTRTEIGSKFNLTGQRVGQLLKTPIGDLLSRLDIDPPGPRHQRLGRGQHHDQ
jgi:RNA polymerase sigma factor (sigma-70 family)